MNMYIMNEIKRKWWQIVLIGVICAIAIIFCRTILVKPKMVHGPINASVIFALDDQTPNLVVKPETQIKGILNSQGYIVGFIKQTSDTIDWNKINSNWDKMDSINQFKWYQQHFFVNSDDPKLYELYIMFNPNDIQDEEYVKTHLDALTNQYIAYANRNVQAMSPYYSIRVIQKEIVFGDDQHHEEGFLFVKYGIIGFVLGVLVMSILVSVTAMRKYRHGR